VSTLLHDTVYMFLHNLLNVLVQIANKKRQDSVTSQLFIIITQHLEFHSTQMYSSSKFNHCLTDLTCIP
jgi:hypothetical protein